MTTTQLISYLASKNHYRVADAALELISDITEIPEEEWIKDKENLIKKEHILFVVVCSQETILNNQDLLF